MIENIDIKKLKIHPKNVRKTYDDIEELAESIKAQGILQNLTVVPDPDESGMYLTVIGNRRLTAARVAGLETVPCVVADMNEKEQTSVMLLENMQRSDLTVVEQAQGFQMMLDLGETEDSIAEKTGFSKITVRRRVNIAKLDQKKLQEKEADEDFQLSLMDLYSLERIPDIETRNEILDKADSSGDLARLVGNAIREAARKKNEKKLYPMLEEMGIQKAPDSVQTQIYSGKWETVKTLDLEEELPDEEEIDIAFDGKEKLYYYTTWREVKIIKKKKKEVREKTPYEIKQQKRKANKKAVDAIGKEMKAKVRDFIMDMIDGKVDGPKKGKEPVERLWEILVDAEAYCNIRRIAAFRYGKTQYELTNEEKENGEEWAKELGTFYQMLIIALSNMDVVEASTYDGRPNQSFRDKMDQICNVLHEYGFRIDDEEELAVLNGTNELYCRTEGVQEDE